MNDPCHGGGGGDDDDDGGGDDDFGQVERKEAELESCLSEIEGNRAFATFVNEDLLAVGPSYPPTIPLLFS